MTPLQAADTTTANRSSARFGWPGALYALIALTSCVFAFIGLSSSSFWADELYTMQVVDHHLGLGEVFRRVLADVHPPLYDFFLYAWIELAGTREWVVRLPSALLAVLSVAVFALSTRRRLSATAIAFACAVAATSTFWYEQAQNARNYGLAIFLSSLLLGTAMQFRQYASERRFPAGTWAWLTLFGIAASQVHPYMLLTVGVLLLYLLATSPTWPQRVAICVSGALVLGLYIGLLWLMTHTAKHDFHDTWYSNKPSFFASHLRRAIFHFMSRQMLLVVVVMLLVRWRQRRSSDAHADVDAAIGEWTTRLCGVVCVGVIVSGIAVSLLIAPSFSYRNVLVCAPFGWFLLARLYDAAGPRVGTRAGTMAAAIIVLLLSWPALLLMRGRLLPSNEPWRASAAYVQGLPGCQGVTLPVITFPGTYGLGMTSGVHTMVEHNYYGYYLPASYHPYAYLPDEWIHHAIQSSQAESNGCPVIGWGLHDMSTEARALELAKQLASQPGFASHQVVVQTFLAYQLGWLRWKPEPNAFVFLRATPAVLATPASLPMGTAVDRAHSLGERLLVSFNPSAAPEATYTIRRLSAPLKH
ncbi:glycosyltransferase family 39 protein [Dyella monticola]|uniref:glycosyltransferase family 39 protein n=1 Tax=Dyella monticola TaxID=1927958 RepID=UPI0013145A6E|nr:glycosyltransferase family 39 protein [Dyella monticola]